MDRLILLVSAGNKQKGGISMKAIYRVLLAAAITLSLAPAAMATPSGQIWIPSTDAKGFKEVNISIDNYIRFSSSNAGANTYDVGVTAGVSPFEKLKLEIGVDYMTDNVSGSTMSKHPTVFNFKAAVPEDALFKGMPAFAAGMFGIGTYDHGLSGNTMANVSYGLLAKTLPVVGRLSAGGYHGSEKNLGTDNNGLLLSWDRTMSEVSDKLWLGVDYMSGNNYYSALSAGASWTFTPNVSVLVGVNFYNPFQTGVPGGKTTFTTQLDINF
jgi:hypothetical protein